MHGEFQGPLKPNKEKSSVPGETDKEVTVEKKEVTEEDREETEEDREASTSFADVVGLKKGNSEVQKPNGNHSFHFGMMKNGTHTLTFILRCTNNTFFRKKVAHTAIQSVSSIFFSSVGKHCFLLGYVWTSSEDAVLPVPSCHGILLHCSPGQSQVITVFNSQYSTQNC